MSSGMSLHGTRRTCQFVQLVALHVNFVTNECELQRGANPA
jgi:hypothetical protein